MEDNLPKLILMNTLCSGSIFVLLMNSYDNVLINCVSSMASSICLIITCFPKFLLRNQKSNFGNKIFSKSGTAKRAESLTQRHKIMCKLARAQEKGHVHVDASLVLVNDDETLHEYKHRLRRKATCHDLVSRMVKKERNSKKHTLIVQTTCLYSRRNVNQLFHFTHLQLAWKILGANAYRISSQCCETPTYKCTAR